MAARGALPRVGFRPALPARCGPPSRGRGRTPLPPRHAPQLQLPRLTLLRRTAVARAEADRPRMFVPADGLGGEGPEAKGAAALSRLFTFVAIRIVQAQLEGLGNDGGFAPQATGASGDVECPSYDTLRSAMADVPLGDGDTWLEALLLRDATLALRVMAVREAYVADFDWALLAAQTQRRVSEGNRRLMRAHVERSAGAGEPKASPESRDPSL